MTKNKEDKEDKELRVKRHLTAPHVLLPHDGVLLLPGCVEDVQQARLGINVHLLAVRVLLQ